ncbi:MAG TPA: pyridoxamine 5'-phosphate oxidase family protein [Acidimicrobiales bacterium]|nr:pyridoxamine 5'-phosphate oxidase family protein [Acidimicrobiales bacterium]
MSPAARSTGPRSDLGRRLAERRHQLGYSIEQVAAGSSISPAYLEYLEAAPEPEPSAATLVRLANALGTTLAGLRGGDQLVPPGRRPPRPGARLEALSREECAALLAPGGVGRFVYLEGRGPVAVPVNYRVFGDDIVFRTGEGTSLAARAAQVRVSFEVDHIDEALSEGWSVIVTGRARTVTDPVELEELEPLGVHPWAGGRRDVYVRLTPDEVSGRRIRGG